MPTPLLFFCGGGGQKIVCLEARGLRILKAAGGDKVRQHLQLLEQSVVEFTSALVGRKLLMPIGWDF